MRFLPFLVFLPLLGRPRTQAIGLAFFPPLQFHFLFDGAAYFGDQRSNVFAVASGDVRFGAEVIKAGAADFLPIPYTNAQLLDSVASVRADIQAGDEDDRDAQFARALFHMDHLGR
ncbi:MAG: hypothetical protein QOH65_1066 [Methylobacteriaceae bacterium]|jgi:hypothetical protein|nr:hypothetical protein [Methylobacteriaceae bacterium]